MCEVKQNLSAGVTLFWSEDFVDDEDQKSAEAWKIDLVSGVGQIEALEGQLANIGAKV